MSSVGEGQALADAFICCINTTWKQNRNQQTLHKHFQTFAGNPENDQGGYVL